MFLKPVSEGEVKSVVKYLKWEILAGIDEVGECIVNK
jgi:hypothetical protein